IPEERRRLRDQLRVKLQWLGCGPVTKGTWITPHDVREEIRQIANALRAARYIEVFEARHVGFASTESLVAQCWDLPAINRRYQTFIDRWARAFDRCSTCGVSGCATGTANPDCRHPADCFVRRFLLVHEYRRFPLEDPFLPAALLPEDWQGEEAARLFERGHASLTEPAEAYVRSVCDAGAADPVMAGTEP
ncbi:MAG: PaaX family transcriptional regulator C-terminal domain-containing protein, partial [Gemmatimonadales bacterium]